MSTRPTTGNDLERLLAQMIRDIAALKRATTLGLEDWRIEQADNGDLIATYVPTGAVTILGVA